MREGNRHDGIKRMRDVEQSILDDLRSLGDPLLVYAYLIECGKELSPMDARLKSDKTLVKECEVSTWFAVAEDENGGAGFHADSESLIVRGALALIQEVLEAGSVLNRGEYEWRLLEDPIFAKSFTQAQLRGLKFILSRL